MIERLRDVSVPRHPSIGGVALFLLVFPPFETVSRFAHTVSSRCATKGDVSCTLLIYPFQSICLKGFIRCPGCEFLVVVAKLLVVRSWSCAAWFHVMLAAYSPPVRSYLTDGERAELFLVHMRATFAPHGAAFVQMVKNIAAIPAPCPEAAIMRVWDARPKYCLRKLCFSILPASSKYV